jgi:hypothetical protein
MTDNTGLRLPSTEDRRHILQYGKCINCGWDYMEQQWNISTIRSELVLLEFNKTKNPKFMHG